MAAVMKKSTHPRVPPPLTPPLCPLDLPFPWRPPCPTDPCPQTGWLRAFSLIMRLAPPAKGLRPPDFHDLLRLLRSEWFSETSLFTRELKKLRKLRYLVDVLESRGWIFENSLNWFSGRQKARSSRNFQESLGSPPGQETSNKYDNFEV